MELININCSLIFRISFIVKTGFANDTSKLPVIVPPDNCKYLEFKLILPSCSAVDAFIVVPDNVPLLLIFPGIVNVLLHETLPLNLVIPDTFNDDIHVVELFNVVFPEIFNVDMNVEGLLKLTIEGGFQIAL